MKNATKNYKKTKIQLMRVFITVKVLLRLTFEKNDDTIKNTRAISSVG